MPTEPRLPNGMAINACEVPDPMKPLEAKLYQDIRERHCARKQAAHDCAGRMTIDRKGMTLQCPLCGDARRINPQPATALRNGLSGDDGETQK